MLLEISQNSQKNTCGKVSYLINLQASNTFFREHLWTTASGVEVFCKKGALKKFRKFHRKTPMVESLFNKVAGLTPILKNIYQRMLLYSACITRCFTLYSAPSSFSSLPLLLISLMFLFGSNSKGFKEFKSGISFSLKSLSLVLFYFFIFFLSFSVLFHFFLSLLIKRILLS